MKHRHLTLLIAVLLVLALSLSGCAARSAAHDSAAPEAMAGSGYATNNGMNYKDDLSMEEFGDDSATADSITVENALTSSTTVSSPNASQLAEKIIYTGSAEVETTEFDLCVEQVYDMVQDLGGFLESSSVSGKDYHTTYYDNYAYRRAEFVIRVPRENFSSMQDALSTLGYVTDVSTWTENITARYMDTESRLNAYRAEEKSLLTLMEKAQTVEEMITVQSRLSEVRYEIESLTSTLRYYQSQVDYSTLTLYIREVAKIVEKNEMPTTYWDEICQAFVNGVDVVVDSLSWMGTALVTLIPILLIPAIVTVILVIVTRRKNRLRREAQQRAWQAQQNQNPQN